MLNADNIWENLPELARAAILFSDAYKEAHGIRPAIDTTDWTVEDYSREMVKLQSVINENEASQARLERENIRRIEDRILGLISMGAWDREAAIRRLHESEDTGGDNDYLCYRLGLPYGYFSQQVAA